MERTFFRTKFSNACFAVIIAAASATGLAKAGFAQGWRYYGGDPGGMKYSALTQINRSNVKSLRVAWIFHTGDLSDGTTYPVRSSFECTPLVIDGVMYITTPFARVIALNAASGKQLWAFDPKLNKNHAYNLFINRGVAFWQHGNDKRVFVGTLDGRLFELNASDGKPVKAFGDGGHIDLRKDNAEAFPDLLDGMSSPPQIYKNLVIAGSIVSDSQPQGPSGDLRAFDVYTGKLVWRFHVIQRPGGGGGAETWPDGAWKQRGGGNAWSLLSLDKQRGILYVPFTSPSYDYFGGDRAGKDLFGNSLVALDANTGRMLWYYQIVHHDIWDYDLPAQPVLVTVHRNGHEVPAVAQVTKMGLVFLFNRLTGKPLFHIVERKVPPSPIPGEHTWPTQPFPVKPAPVARNSFTLSDLTNVTPESRAECMALLKNATFGGPYRPYGLKTTILYPSTNGGPNWGGASFDPATQTLYVNSMDEGEIGHMVAGRPGSIIPYRLRATRFWDSHQYFCVKPPWGRLTAINLNTGDFRWQVSLGVVDSLLAKGIPPTGSANIGGSMVTAGGLVFIAATNDGRFRAFDKDTGEELWETKLPASGFASPMTFMDARTHRQYVVIAAGGGNKYDTHFSDALVAYALLDASALRQSAAAAVPATRASAPSAEQTTAPSRPVSQPIPFSHKQHCAANIPCAMCHQTAYSGEMAGLPADAVCMSCHQTVAKDNPAIQKVALLAKANKAIPWVRIYKLQDFVFFSHKKHTDAKVPCKACHGEVCDKDVLSQEVRFSMMFCVKCHQAEHATTKCDACHTLSM